jgi:cytochrome c oxidase subunit 4
MAEHDTHAHPSNRVYLEVALILAAITLVELGLLYLPAIGLEGVRPVLVPAFIGLSAAKFLLVIGWYMHLRFDPAVFRRIFGFALVVALVIGTAFIALFHGIYP